ncbi:MAG: hypothetical protein A370_00604 [Clostridium sp. Maddingley MBC34-26]|nr:MAG: hypothetical protein A370_00604 [Clostridium sp. Maddingley MBC34-26]
MSGKAILIATNAHKGQIDKASKLRLKKSK